MNRFDIDRYEHLTHIKSDLGRQRSWLRSCLNEHCLERFTIAVLANTNLTDQYYEDWCFLLDKSCSSSLPLLIAGLETILFAINIDSEYLNTPSKLFKSNTLSCPIPATQEIDTFQISSSMPDSVLAMSESRVIKLKKNKSLHTRRKNNVILFDNDEPEQERTPSPQTNENDSVFEKSSLNEPDEAESPKSPKIVVNSTELSESDNSFENITTKSFSIHKSDSASNLIPVCSKFDTVSVYSYQSETSELNMPTQEQTGVEAVANYSANLKPAEINNLLKRMNSQTRVSDSDGLSMKEMREFVLTLMQRKDDLDERFKRLEAKHKEEMIRNEGLVETLRQMEEEKASSTAYLENRIQNLEGENKLLKDQLKKYVSAVQLIRSAPANPTASSPDKSVVATALPAVNENLQRDYSYEAEQYEKKLIQVAEMHGELMEFNSRLHLIINFKTIQLEKLKSELVELRGPVSACVLLYK